MKKKLFLIDASSYLFRAYHAIQNMTNEEGKSTNALYGFISSFMKLVKDFEPTHVASIFDGPQSWQTRLDIYPEYKANRSACPPDLSHQIEWAKDFCDLYGIPSLSVPNVEADDTIGSVALFAKEQDFEVLICSEDKDLCQIVDEQISLLHTRKENLVVGPAEVHEKFGVRPDQIIDYLAIVGDASDNVPGLPGMGPKTAMTLLNEYETLENVLAHADDFKGKKQETLKNFADQARLSQKLVTIDTQVDFPHEIRFFELKEQSREPLREFLANKQFNRFLKELGEEVETKEEEPVNYHLVESLGELKTLIETLSKQSLLCFDTETTNPHPLLAETVGIGLGYQSGESWYIPLNGEMDRSEVLGLLKGLFENEQIQFCAHNIKYDLHILKNKGIEVKNVHFDTILASYVLHAGLRQHSLDALALSHFGKVKTPISDLIGKGKKQITMKEVEIQKVADYCNEDVDYTYRLMEEYGPEIEERGLSDLFYRMEMPLVKVLEKMERTGIYLDVDYLKKFSETISKRIEENRSKIYEMAGMEFNLNSPKQLGEVLFEKLQIPPPKKTATGAYSTAADVLETMRDNYPIVEEILDYRTLEKLRSTYVDALPEQVNPQTGRIHCTFNQFIAATGRLSSHDPNLQNIPIRTELGREIRRAFIPEKSGSSFLSADYSQIELRLVAHLSEDPEMLHAFHEGKDVHSHTASKVFEVPLEEVTKEMRHAAKAVNFGIIYGQGKYGLSQQLKISQKEAGEFIEKYFDRYKKVKEYMEATVEQARKAEKAVTFTGRERPLPEINSKNGQLMRAAERLAINTPLQGAAADLMKMAMIQIDRLFQERDFPPMMLLQIHDELLFEVPDPLLPEVEKIVRGVMEGVWQLKVPLVVDIAVGKNWAEC